MTVATDLSVTIGSLKLRNPVVTASGTFASGREYANFVDLSRLGAVVTKGVSLKPWAGNASPRIAETSCGMLNSIGLQNPGLDVFTQKDLGWLETQDVPVIVNVSGHTVEEYAEVCRKLDGDRRVDAFEINISCPNVDSGGMVFGTSCPEAASVVSACREATSKTLIVKLSPNVTDITEIARAVVDAGADCVSLINTLLGMAVDADTRRPKLARVVGGLSGPAIKPVALRMVWQVANAVEVPIIGMGGIADAQDAIEFMLAGATAVAVGTANFVDPTSTMRIVDGLTEYAHSRELHKITELIGALEV